MKIEEFIDSLQIYEMTFPTNQFSSKSSSKSKGVTLKSTEEDSVSDSMMKFQ